MAFHAIMNLHRSIGPSHSPCCTRGSWRVAPPESIASQIVFFDVDSFTGGKSRTLLDFLKIDSCQTGFCQFAPDGSVARCGLVRVHHQQKVLIQAEKHPSQMPRMRFPLFFLTVCTSLLALFPALVAFSRDGHGKPV